MSFINSYVLALLLHFQKFPNNGINHKVLAFDFIKDVDNKVWNWEVQLKHEFHLLANLNAWYIDTKWIKEGFIWQGEEACNDGQWWLE